VGGCGLFVFSFVVFCWWGFFCVFFLLVFGGVCFVVCFVLFVFFFDF